MSTTNPRVADLLAISTQDSENHRWMDFQAEQVEPYLRCAFIGFVLVYLPARFFSWSGLVEPATTGASQVAGMIMVAIGTAIALWCVLVFVFIGKGTSAPFDPPRKLVVRGPYRFVRNPMYIGAGMTLAGAGLYYESLSILLYTGLFFLITHLFVVLYEEPTLRRTFGTEYEAYCRRVRRWWVRAGRAPGKNEG